MAKVKADYREKERSYSLRDLLALPGPAQAVWDPFLRPREKALLIAPHKSGKTFFLLQLGLLVAAGRPFLGYECRKAPVLYVDLEVGSHLMAERVRALCEQLEIDDESADPFFTLYEARGMDLVTERGYLRREFKQKLEEFREGLVIIDPWQNVAAGFRERELKKLLQEIDKVLAENNLALIAAGHIDKRSARKGEELDSYSLKGLSFQGDWADLLLILKPEKEKEGRFRLKVKGRSIVEPDIDLVFQHSMWEPSTSPRSKIEETKELILRLLTENGLPTESGRVLPRRKLQEEVLRRSSSLSTFKRALKSLEGKRLILIRPIAGSRYNAKEVVLLEGGGNFGPTTMKMAKIDEKLVGSEVGPKLVHEPTIEPTVEPTKNLEPPMPIAVVGSEHMETTLNKDKALILEEDFEIEERP